MNAPCHTVVRALVPLQVAYLAAHRAMQCPHINQVRKAGGRAKHIAATHPVYSRARAALVRAYDVNDADRSDKVAALAAAEEILKGERAARGMGKTWNMNAAVDAWLEKAPRI